MSVGHSSWATKYGVSPEVVEACDLVMPQYGVKQSINVSVCAGVILWQTALHMRHG